MLTPLSAILSNYGYVRRKDVGKRDYFCETLRLISFARITAKCKNIIISIIHILYTRNELNKSSKGIRNAIFDGNGFFAPLGRWYKSSNFDNVNKYYRGIMTWPTDRSLILECMI